MGYGLEVDMIRLAHERDFLTAPYVFTDDEATAMAEAGADVLVPHMGLTTGGAIGARDGEDARASACSSSRRCTTPRSASTRTSSFSATAARSPSPTTPPTCSSTPKGIVGFFGASSMERLPTEVAMTENMRRFKSIPVNTPRRNRHEHVRQAGRCRAGAVRLGHDRLALPAGEHGREGLVVMDVTLEPGEGHAFHRHAGRKR